MSRIIIDTSAYSAFMRGHKGVVQTLREAETIYINAIIIGELLAGFARGKYEKKNREELETFIESPRAQFIEIDYDTAERYAFILNSLRKTGTPIPTNDIWIAASAMQYGLKIVTTDAHFKKVPQVMVGYYKSLS